MHKIIPWLLRCRVTALSHEVSNARATDKHEEVSRGQRGWSVKIILKYMANSYIYCEWWYLSCISRTRTLSLDWKVWPGLTEWTRHISHQAHTLREMWAPCPIVTTKLHDYNERNKKWKETHSSRERDCWITLFYQCHFMFLPRAAANHTAGVAWRHRHVSSSPARHVTSKATNRWGAMCVVRSLSRASIRETNIFALKSALFVNNDKCRWLVLPRYLREHML